MKLVFASDSFKGSLSSTRIAELLEQAAHETLPNATCIAFPIADGGEGTLDAVARTLPCKHVVFPAHDGLMRPLESRILIHDGTAFIEAATTCGLTLLEDDERNPLATSSFGVGECIRFALDQGCETIAIGLGGSCTNDGGMGCLRALGIRFLDAEGSELPGCGADLEAVARLDERGLHPQTQNATITVLSDVDNPLLGPHGATHVFGRQKGADDAALEALESGMRHFADVIAATHPEADFSTPGFGAAGGLGMALSMFLGARIRPGIDELLDLTSFDAALAGADLVVTGEGRLDRQSLHGKAVGGVASRAKRAGVPVAAICGTVALEADDLQALGLSRVIDASEGQPPHHAIAHAEENYLKAAEKLFFPLRFGIRPAIESDFARIMDIYAIARAFMAEHGNPNQWGPTNWPPESLIHRDIAQGKSYVCESDGRIVGVFYFDFGRDIEPTYARIEDGSWLDEGPYGVVHRIASDNSVKGVGSACLDWAFRQCGHLRIDTHGDNVVMQRLLAKLGFEHRGTIYVEEDDYPRLAFEKTASRTA